MRKAEKQRKYLEDLILRYAVNGDEYQGMPDSPYVRCAQAVIDAGYQLFSTHEVATPSWMEELRKLSPSLAKKAEKEYGRILKRQKRFRVI